MGMNLNCWNFDRFPVTHAGQTRAERNCHDFPFGRRAGKQHTSYDLRELDSTCGFKDLSDQQH